jgi:hypothetical protein
MRGVEPPTFALRMRAINLLPLLISVGIVYVNQQVKRHFLHSQTVVALIEIRQNIVLVPTWCLHGVSDGTKESGC